MEITTKSIKSQVMSIAASLFSTCKNRSEAVKKAWKAIKITTAKIASFEFFKISTGELRSVNNFTFAKIDFKNCNVMFSEITESGAQFRSFKIANLV